MRSSLAFFAVGIALLLGFGQTARSSPGRTPSIQADTRIWSPTVYALAEEGNGAIATHIRPYTTSGTQTCPLTTLPNDSSYSSLARAPTVRFRFERSVYLITAAEL